MTCKKGENGQRDKKKDSNINKKENSHGHKAENSQRDKKEDSNINKKENSHGNKGQKL